MDNILQELRHLGDNSLLVKVFAYGYLDGVARQFSDGTMSAIVFRRQLYLLTVAVETRLGEIEKEGADRARRAMIASQEGAARAERQQITKE